LEIMKEKNFSKKSLMLGCLLAIVVFTNCEKDNSELLPNLSENGISATKNSSKNSTTASQGVLDVSSASPESGYAYYLGVNFPISGDSQSAPTSSTLKIYENGKELGPAHSSHKDVRTLGKGRFSHWGKELYFSASDNTNPI